MYKKSILNNGITLLEAPILGTNAVTVLILVKVGSRYEAKDINGVSHFIEHLFFKGTKKRPTTLSLSKVLDSVGAEYNAFTSKNVTGYYIKISNDNLKLALDVLSDMLTESLFLAEEINREKKVIIEEINMYEDNPMLYVEDVFESIVFKNNTLARKISGEKENIIKMKRSDILDFKNRFYSPENMVISVAGNVDSKVVELINKYFVIDKLKKGNRKNKFTVFSNFQKEPQVKILYKDTAQVQLALGVPSLEFTNKDLPVLSLLNVILGGNMSSRLFIKVRERKGLAYFIKSDINTYEDTGSLMIQSGLDKSRIKEALKVILQELDKICKQGIKNFELDNAKSFIKGKSILNLEDSLHLAEWYAKQSIYTEEIKTPEQKFEQMMKVTPEQIQSLANKIIKKSKLNLALVGPFKEEKVFKDILEKF